ncbi:MAG: hypothetical protein WBX11_00965 [Thiobacillaceae bacterium]
MAGGIRDLNFIENVTERDIDFLVLEELQVSQEFRDWFSSRVFERPVFKSHIGAWHSVVDAELGESDLVFIFDAEDQTTKAILVENKIAANAQPDQGNRYTKRGDRGAADGLWQEFRTCIIAPRKYLESPTQAESYDCEISYEEIMAYFVARRSSEPRQDYRAKVVLEGVEQHRRGYQPKVSDAMTEFALRYWQFAQEHYPELGMPEPKPRPAGSTWINFYPSSFPKGVDFIHQVTGGVVKVFFKGKASDFEAIEARYKDLASVFPELQIQLAGKSVSIAVPVEVIAPLQQSFHASQASVSAALDIAQSLAREIPSRGFPT